MKLLIAASEAKPYVKTGGLADVTGALLEEYRRMDIEAYLMLPLYRSVRQRFDLTDTGLKVTVPVGNRQYSGRIFSHGPAAFFVECDAFFDRDDLYGTPEEDYADNAARFIFFDRALLEACRMRGLYPDVIHCNDWQTGLIPVYLKTLYRNEVFRRTATVMTVHNLGYQGLFDASHFPLSGLPREWFNPEGVEFYGKVNFLKAGLISADILTTVSDTYAKEILTREFGFGLEGVLGKRAPDLHGVRNGIDTAEWDPGNDRYIPARYDASDLSGKAVCRKELIRECSLRMGERDSPLVAMTGRLSSQKGIDIFLDSADEILSMGAKIIILGKGDSHFQKRVEGLGEAHKGNVYVHTGYDEALAHRIYAGSDLLLMPSLYEPCGLSQLISMRYGTIPVARKTGGLVDTITDHEPLKGYGTGFLFREYAASSLAECLRRAFSVYVDKRRWKRMISDAMKKDFSWKKSAVKYVELYKKAMEMKTAARTL
jgi:starch synthase